MATAGMLKERDRFLKRQADATALIASASSASNEKRSKIGKITTGQKNGRSKSAIGRSKTSSDFNSDYRTPTTSTTSAPRLKQLLTIVDFLKKRYLDDPDSDPLTLDQIEKESEDLTLDLHTKHWLASEALLSNPRIDVKSIDDVNKFHYKPPLELKGSKNKSQALLNLLKVRHEKCEGAITVDDVRDSIKNADGIIKRLKDKGDIFMTVGNKKDILFYNDRAYALPMNPEFVEAWRMIPVEGLDDEKIREFLDNHGHIGLAKGVTRRAPIPTKPSRRGRRPETMKHNQHIAHQLETYTDMSGKK